MKMKLIVFLLVILLPMVSAEFKCEEIQRMPTRDCRWKAGTRLDADKIAAGGEIAAYKIRWFYGGWSGWYVPGFNDIDSKTNYLPLAFPCSIPVEHKRRIWSYFFDHEHMFILCKNS